MIQQPEIDQHIDRILDGPMPPMQVLIFEQRDLPGEGQIRMCRGWKSDYENTMHFWLKARQRSEWWEVDGAGDGFGHDYERYREFGAELVKKDEPIQYVSLTVGEFYDFINRYGSFLPGKIEPDITRDLGIDSLRQEYISGVSASPRWNSAMALAEFTHEYVAFNWLTTA